MSRTESSLKNLAAALGGQLGGVLISLIARSIFLHYLNEEYLGLNGLFTNILTVFSLVELGVGPAMNFALYKPLAEHDTQRLKSLMALYRKAYILIGCAIALIGLLFTPFYTLLMDKVPDIPQLTIIYWLFTANTVISYFFSYKRALMICDEHRYIATVYRYIFYYLTNIAQIVILVLTRNYILFLAIQVFFTFAENVSISRKADKMYPYLRERDIERLPREAVLGIKRNIFAMLFHKIGGMIVFSTDNLILSRFVSLAAVGLYSNYYLITDALNKIIGQVFSSLTASVGNLNASQSMEDRQKLEKTFDRIFFLNFWIYGFSSCCLWVLFNPFISLWLGEAMLFDRLTVLIIVVNFYLTGMRKTAMMFREATGAFYFDRYKPLIEAVINLVVSIILARRMGTAGVFLGTIISTLSTCIWIEPYILFKHVFRSRMRPYMMRLLSYTAVTLLACAITSCLTSRFTSMNALLAFGLRMLSCLVVPNAVFFICYGRSAYCSFYISLIRKLVKKLKEKGGSAL